MEPDWKTRCQADSDLKGDIADVSEQTKNSSKPTAPARSARSLSHRQISTRPPFLTRLCGSRPWPKTYSETFLQSTSADTFDVSRSSSHALRSQRTRRDALAGTLVESASRSVGPDRGGAGRRWWGRGGGTRAGGRCGPDGGGCAAARRRAETEERTDPSSKPSTRCPRCCERSSCWGTSRGWLHADRRCARHTAGNGQNRLHAAVASFAKSWSAVSQASITKTTDQQHHERHARHRRRRQRLID